MNPQTFPATARESENDPRTYIHDLATLTTYTKGGYIYTSIDIENQHKVGICTAISLIQNAEKAIGKKYSPDFQYLLQKTCFDNDWNEGSSLFNALKSAKRFGFLPIEYFTHITEADRILPYSQYIAKLQAIPASEVQRLIALCEPKLSGYARLDISNKENIAHAVDSSVSGIYCRYAITDRWWTPTWNPVDIDPLKGDGNLVGGHAINLTAYDYTNGSIQTLANTWGTLWDVEGNAHVDYSLYQMTEGWIPYYDLTPLPTPQFTQTLQVGSTGSEVKMLQQFLKVNPVSGYFGMITKTAVIAFQKSNNLPQTGIVGPLTRALLNKGATTSTPMNISTHTMRTVGLLAVVFAVAGLQAVHDSVPYGNIIDMIVAVLLIVEHTLQGNTQA